MDRQKAIKEVTAIILKHAKPDRIYLYGSSANGEAADTSDIDIAFTDKNFRDIERLKSEINKIETLLKIDVTNLALTEERFKNRVMQTGKVLYSANKKLRAEDALYNLTKALERFRQTVDIQDKFKKEGFGDFYLDLIVKRFEFTYEMAWKAIKRYLDYSGIECTTPRECFKEAFAQKIIKDETVWLDMIESRNLSSHIYDEDEIKGILNKIEEYKSAFITLKSQLDSLQQVEN